MDSLIAANISQRPLRTAISVIGVALGVVLVTLFVGLPGDDARCRETAIGVDAEVRFFREETFAGRQPVDAASAYADAILNGVQPTAEILH
jgi:hypothetical protein